MHLKSNAACANDLPSFSPSVAWCTDRIKSASRGRQGGVTRQRSLPCCLACGIDIKDDVTATLSIPQTTNGSVCPSLHKAVLLEESAKRFQAGMVYVSEEAAQARTVRQVSTTKQSHERCSKGS